MHSQPPKVIAEVGCNHKGDMEIAHELILTASMMFGTKWVERHITLDRTWKGTDHSASLEPDGMRKLARDVHRALKHKATDLLPVEQIQSDKLKFKKTES